jgi:uncharacterized protein YlxW (UPF0749 family)
MRVNGSGNMITLSPSAAISSIMLVGSNNAVSLPSKQNPVVSDLGSGNTVTHY